MRHRVETLRQRLRLPFRSIPAGCGAFGGLIAHRPFLSGRIGQSARDDNRSEFERLLPLRKRDASLASEVFGRSRHTIRKRNRNRLVYRIDDGLPKVRALGIRRNEVTDVLGSKLWIESGNKYCGTHDLRVTRSVMRKRITWRRHIRSIQFKRLRTIDKRLDFRIGDCEETDAAESATTASKRITARRSMPHCSSRPPICK